VFVLTIHFLFSFFSFLSFLTFLYCLFCNRLLSFLLFMYTYLHTYTHCTLTYVHTISVYTCTLKFTSILLYRFRHSPYYSPPHHFSLTLPLTLLSSPLYTSHNVLITHTYVHTLSVYTCIHVLGVV
jgi:hypothetical protein